MLVIAAFVAVLAQAVAINFQGSDVKWAMNCDYSNGDIGSEAGPGSACGGHCKARADCTHFVWAGGRCYMKHLSSDAQAKQKSGGGVCGFINGRAGGSAGEQPKPPTEPSNPGKGNPGGAGKIGVGYGLIGPHKVSFEDGLKKLKGYGVRYLKGWNIDTNWLSAVRKVYGDGNVGVTVAIHNGAMGKMAHDAGYRKQVAQQLKQFDGIIDILAISNEPTLNGVMNDVLPAVKAAKKMIQDNGLDMRLTVPFMTGVLTDTYPVANSRLADKYSAQVKAILNEIDVFSINLYPYFAYAYTSDIPLDMAIGQGLFKNMLDGARVALGKVGKGSMPIVVGESGWPTSGGKGASAPNAEKFIKSLVQETSSGPAERVYIFEAFDETGKPGDGVERNFGIMTAQGSPKFNFKLN